MDQRRVIIDTDPGIDDAAAILFALGSDSLSVELFTTVYGNSSIQNCTRNLLRILETVGRSDIPVYQGAARPLLREPHFAPMVHGEDGFGDVLTDQLDLAATSGRAVERLIETVLAAPGEIDLLALGPLTNVALALSVEPALASALRSLVVMGGAVRTHGNVSPVASANLFNDPEAAAIVYRSGAPIVQVGLDVCRPTLITHQQLERIWAAGHPQTELLRRITPCIMSFYQRAEGQLGGVHYNDVPATAYLVAPDLFRTERLAIRIESGNELTAGQTVAFWPPRWTEPPNAEVCLEVDAERLSALFTETLVRGAGAGE